MKQKQNSLKAALAVLVFLTSLSVSGGNRYDYTFDVQRNYDVTSYSVCKLNAILVKQITGYAPSNIEEQVRQGIMQYLAVQPSGNVVKVSCGDTIWYATSGIRTTKVANYCTAVKFNTSSFLVGHNTGKAVKGETYQAAIGFVNVAKQDTLVYHFNVTLGDRNEITDNQPTTIAARKDYTDDWLVRPMMQKNDEAIVYENILQVQAGDRISLGAVPRDESLYTECKYQWCKVEWDAKKKEEKVTSLSKYEDGMFTVTESATTDNSGRYVCKTRLKKTDGSLAIRSYYYYVDVQNEAPGSFHTWNAPQLAYDFKTEYPNIQQPEKLHTIKKKNGTPANSYSGEWWSAFWGDNLNSECGDEEQVMAAAKNMVEKYDYDFAYIRDSIGWPPDLSARKGWKSFVYIFGSGLNNDSESNTTQGGYQSSTYVDGQNWACVWASYYPFSRFRDDADQKWSDGEYQRNAMVHEGIHATFADLNACQGSSWFHEGGNTWLQGQVYARRDGVHGDAGFLDGGPFLAPHMPIECYSGWLQDGSYGGPAAQGVNMYAGNGKQVCTWRSYLGGVQYANAFPTVIASVCGDKSIAWIWRYCKNRVLETMGDTLGDAAMREIILQYRARQALFDLGGWDNSYRAVTNSYFGTSQRAEWRNGVCSTNGGSIVGASSSSDQMPCWIDVEPVILTPYQSVSINDNYGWMAPDTLTNPGWSGGNIIPIHINPDGDIAEVEFRPEDTNMKALLCYRTKAGECYYSHPVECGTIRIDLSMKPANGVIFCVVVNTDYIYTGDAQRKHHWDYRIRLGKNANQVADIYKKWYYYEQNITDPSYDPVGIGEVEIEGGRENGSDKNEYQGIRLMSGNIRVGDCLNLDLNGTDPHHVVARIVGAQGVVVQTGTLNADGTFTLPNNIPAGFYIVSFAHDGKKDVFKIIIK